MHDFIRDDIVDLCKYLPAFLKKDPEFAAKLKAESSAHDDARKTLIDLFEQFFVSTATWGLENWERFLALPHDKADSDEKRRNRILISLRGPSTTTLENVRNIVQSYGTGSVEEHNDKYYFIIFTTEADAEALNEMRRKIEVYKPAHLGCYVYLGWSWNGKINFDGKYTYGTSTEEWSGNNG